MAIKHIERPARRYSLPIACGVGLGFAVLAGLAHAAEVATTPRGAMLGLSAIMPSGKLGELRALRLKPGGAPPSGIAAAARRALPMAPLAFEPFYGAAVAGFRTAESSGSTKDGVLLREALRRNPRSRETRALLLRHALGSGQLAPAIDQLAGLNRLRPDAIGQLMIAFGQTLTTREQVVEAVDALKPHPELYGTFLGGFANANKSPELAVAFVTRMPANSFADPKVRRAAIDLLIQAQAYGPARALWSDGASKGNGALVYSPNFSDFRASPPFNWALAVDETGAAERRKGGGLEVIYYGRRAGGLASQLLTLQPGTYSAMIKYKILSGLPGAIGLELRCVGAGQALGIRPLDGKLNAEMKAALTVTIPEQGCAGQMLALVGRPIEERRQQEVLVENLDLVRGGQQ